MVVRYSALPGDRFGAKQRKERKKYIYNSNDDDNDNAAVLVRLRPLDLFGNSHVTFGGFD